MSMKMAEPKTEIGAEIRAARLRKGLSQAELADMVGVSLMTIHRLEAGKTAPRKTTLNAIKAALAEECKTAEPDLFPDPFGCRDEILRFFAAAEDLIRARKTDLDAETPKQTTNENERSKTMEFTQTFYPVDKAIFDRLIEKRGLTKQEMGIAMGYSRSAIGEAVRQGRASRKIAAALFANYGITPNDYAPKVPCVNAPAKAPDIGVMRFDAAGRELRLDGTPVPKPKINPVDEALLPDGVYTLEFVDVRPGRRVGDQAEGYRFVTIATGNERRMPYYFSLYNRDYGGKTENGVGAEWILHLLRVALGADWHDDCAVNEIVGHRVRAYVMIYEKAGKRYNRTIWVEPVEMMPEPAPAVGWQDVLNMQTDSETLWAALQYIAGELHLRSHED